MFRSGYYNFVKRLGQPEHDADLAEKIRECQNKTDKTYGYRWVWKWLKDRNIDTFTSITTSAFRIKLEWRR